MLRVAAGTPDSGNRRACVLAFVRKPKWEGGGLGSPWNTTGLPHNSCSGVGAKIVCRRVAGGGLDGMRGYGPSGRGEGGRRTGRAAEGLENRLTGLVHSRLPGGSHLDHNWITTASQPRSQLDHNPQNTHVCTY